MAALVAVGALVAFAVFGALGYARSGASGAAANVAHSVSNLAKQDHPTAKGEKNGKDRKKDDHGGNDDDHHGGNNDDHHGGNNDDHHGGNNDDHHGGNNDDDGDDDGEPGDDQYVEKVLICHATGQHKAKRYITLKLPPRGARAHLQHHPFDYAGPCHR